jgi:hypothetical protein
MPATFIVSLLIRVILHEMVTLLSFIPELGRIFIIPGRLWKSERLLANRIRMNEEAEHGICRSVGEKGSGPSAR